MENKADDFVTAIRPTLSVSNGVAAVGFYKKAFNAIELVRVEDPDGAIVAELSINGARFFVADGSPEAAHPTPEKAGSIPIRMGLIVANPDAFAASAIAAGATEVYPYQIRITVTASATSLIPTGITGKFAGRCKPPTSC